MCDTVVATARATADGAVWLGKNSDREGGEPQALEIHAAADHPEGAALRCTHVEIAQTRHTHRVLLSRPVWMWGAEMGVNDVGVAVGNEAVFTRAPEQPSGLTGMDLVRLALERASTASAAVEVIAELLETHGQGGRCGFRNEGFRYHNSFLVADPSEAWVLETADRAWVAQRVEGVRAISNALTIGERHDRAMEGLAAHARDLGLHHGKGPLHFARTFSRPLIGWAAAAGQRRGCVEAALRASPVTDERLMAALRQHHPSGRFAGAGLRQTVCAHGGWLPTRAAGQTTASLVARLAAGDGAGPLCWATGTSAPCTSVFKPVWLDTGLGGYQPVTTERYAAGATWWRHERLMRRAMADLPGFLRRFAPERGDLERALRARAHPGGDTESRAALTEQAFRLAEELDERWLARVPSRGRRTPYWRSLSRRDGTPLGP